MRRNENYGRRQFYDGLRDFGDRPLVINIDKATAINQNFRISLWTGEYLQITAMNIPVGGEIGVEMHQNHDQFLRIEQGTGLVCMGRSEKCLNEKHSVNREFAVAIPAGVWHNIINTGRIPLKLYSVYSPPKHPFGTLQRTNREEN